jgi:succinoglycan biosynthesis protein ExoA
MNDENLNSILVIIPTLNEFKVIEQVIDSLAEDLPQDALIAVVDGGSRDGTAELVKGMLSERKYLRFLHNEKKIQSAAVNAGVKAFGGQSQVLIRCDAHASYPKAYVRRLVDALERTKADAIVVPMDSSGETCFQKAVAWISDTKVGSGGSAHRAGTKSGYVDHGHHAAFRMASFKKAGGYDETFTHNEDAELDCRQRILGSQIFLDSEIRIGYMPRSSIGRLAKQYFSYGKGRSRTVRRHPGTLRLRQFIVPFHLFLLIFGILISPWTVLGLVWPLLYLVILLFSSVKIAVTKKSICGLFGGVAAAVMHVTWASGFIWGFLILRESRWELKPALSVSDA